jgi:WD40 repeat protein
MIASASGDDTVRLWDAATGESIGQPFSGHRDLVYAVAFPGRQDARLGRPRRS